MKNIFTLFAVVAFSVALKAQTNIYTQAFNTFPPTGWTNVDNTSNSAGTWKRVTTAGPRFTTRTNGYAIFDSDGLGNDGKPEDATLTSGAINCAAYTHVAVEFQSLFSQYDASQGTFQVSNDNSNWVDMYTVNTSSSLNPEIIRLDISGIAANQSTVYLRFHYTGDYDFFWAVDDIKVYEPSVLDVAIDKFSNERFVGLGNQVITGTLTNLGSTPVNTVTLTYTDNAGTPVTQTLNSLNLGIFESYEFSLTTPVVMSTPSLHAITLTASDPNGNLDQVSSNNTMSKEITALSAIAEKNVLFEEFTTCQCGWCPAGHYIASQIQASAPYFIPVNVHAGFGTDAMTISEASTLAASFANGAPTGCVDRVFYEGEEEVAISRGIWQSKVTERHNKVSPAALDAESVYDENSRALNVTVTARFFGPANGTFRVNCYVIEDSVTGTGSGYNQSNYLSGTNGFQSYPTYSLPDPIPGYQHRHVQRQVLSGNAWGTANVIPASTTDGGTYSKTYSTTLNSNWDASRCKLVAFVHEYNSSAYSGKNEVFNVVEIPLNGRTSQSSTPSVYTTGIAELNNVENMSVYPNPATDLVTVEFSLKGQTSVSFEVTNTLGQVVYTIPQAELERGGFNAKINTADFANGLYFVTLKTQGAKLTKRFVVSK